MPTPAAPYRRGAVGLARRVLATVVLAVLLGWAALLVVAAIGAEVGTGGLVVGGLLALLPVVPVSLCFVWLDRWEPEPPAFLLLALGWGATIAAGISLVVNTAAVRVMLPVLGEAESYEVAAVLVAPFVEEAAKGAFLVGFLLLRRHEFDGVVDGIVLGGLVGVGFAFTENVLYFGRAFTEGVAAAGVVGGVTSSGATFVARGILSPFAHPLFTVMTGIGLGIAVTTRQRWLRPVAAVGGFVVAFLLHSLWNASATSGANAFVTLYATVMIPVFVAAVAIATWSRRREGAVVRRQLPAYAAAGWLAPYEPQVLASMPARRQLVRQAAQRGGPETAQATRDYHAAATELAFLRERVLNGTAVGDAAEMERGLLGVLAERRRRAYVPVPAVAPGRPL
ncbi:MAG TPA: PrsW family intramembrane metalloprotease [Jiangellales bacterium]|nr:PrsW family intramembrane metalloprotease [Jiangellales bacterium]